MTGVSSNRELAHEAAYNRARSLAKQIYNTEIPKREDNTEEQKAKVRLANEEHWAKTHALSAEIRASAKQ
jgi:hypothetical protein